MILFGKLCLVASVVLLVHAPLRTMAESPQQHSAAPPPAEIQPDDLIGGVDAVAEEAKLREQEARANAKQFIDSMPRLIAEYLMAACVRVPDDVLRKWYRDINRAKQALDRDKLDEADEIARQVQEDIRSKVEEGHSAGHTSIPKADAVLPEPPEADRDDEHRLRSKLVRGGGKVRGFLELLDLLMSLRGTDAHC